MQASSARGPGLSSEPPAAWEWPRLAWNPSAVWDEDRSLAEFLDIQPGQNLSSWFSSESLSLGNRAESDRTGHPVSGVFCCTSTHVHKHKILTLEIGVVVHTLISGFGRLRQEARSSRSI